MIETMQNSCPPETQEVMRITTEYMVAKYNAQHAVDKTRAKHLLPDVNYEGHWSHEAKLREAYYNIRGW